MKVHKLLRIDKPSKGPQLFGMEIEAENVRTVFDSKWWRITEDGSLRNRGMEFITNPISKEDMTTAIKTYYKQHIKRGYEVSCRTGIHVHADMRRRTLDQICSISAAYAAIEPVLMQRYCGEDRARSIFCVPWYEAAGDLSFLREASSAQSRGVASEMISSTCKYSSLFLGPLTRLGTMEFRSAPTYDSAEPALKWLDVIDRLIKFAENRPTAEIVEQAELDVSGLAATITEAACTDAEIDLIEEVDSIGVASRLVRTSLGDPWAMPPQTEAVNPVGAQPRAITARDLAQRPMGRNVTSDFTPMPDVPPPRRRAQRRTHWGRGVPNWTAPRDF